MSLGIEVLSLDNEAKKSLQQAREEVIDKVKGKIPKDQTLSSSKIVSSLENRFVASSMAKSDSGEAKIAARDILIALGEAIRLKACLDSSQRKGFSVGIPEEQRFLYGLLGADIKHEDLKEIQQDLSTISDQGQSIWEKKDSIKQKLETFINKVLEIINPEESFSFEATETKNEDDFPLDKNKTYNTNTLVSSLGLGSGRDISIRLGQTNKVAENLPRPETPDLPREVKLHLVDGTVHDLTLERTPSNIDGSSNTFQFKEDLKEAIPDFKAIVSSNKSPEHEIYRDFIEAVEFV